MPRCLELGAQLGEVLDDAVVDDGDRAGAVDRCGWALRSVGAPWVAQRVWPMPVVAGAAAGASASALLQVGQLAGPLLGQRACRRRSDGDAGGVVAAVLEPPQAVEHDVERRLLHRRIPRFRTWVTGYPPCSSASGPAPVTRDAVRRVRPRRAGRRCVPHDPADRCATTSSTTLQRARRADRPGRGRGGLPAAVPAAEPARGGRARAARGRPRRSSARSPAPRVPFVIGIAGSVAVGKSTTARCCASCSPAGRDHPRVELVTTDGFLLPNAELEPRGCSTARASRVLRPARPAPVPRRREVAAADEVAAPGLLAPDLRHRARRDGRRAPAGRPDRRGPQRAAARPHPTRTDGPALACRDFFDFSIYVDAARADVARLVRRALPARCGRPRSPTRRRTSTGTRRSPTTRRAATATLAIWARGQRAEPGAEHPSRPGAGPPWCCRRARTTPSADPAAQALTTSALAPAGAQSGRGGSRAESPEHARRDAVGSCSGGGAAGRRGLRGRALVVAAFALPVYDSTSSSSSGDDEQGIRHARGRQRDGCGARPRRPALVTLAVGSVLWQRSRWALPIAWTLTGLLAAGNLLAMLSVGVFVLPVTAALVLACARSRPPAGPPAVFPPPRGRVPDA